MSVKIRSALENEEGVARWRSEESCPETTYAILTIAAPVLVGAHSLVTFESFFIRLVKCAVTCERISNLVSLSVSNRCLSHPTSLVHLDRALNFFLVESTWLPAWSHISKVQGSCFRLLGGVECKLQNFKASVFHS